MHIPNKASPRLNLPLTLDGNKAKIPMIAAHIQTTGTVADAKLIAKEGEEWRIAVSIRGNSDVRYWG